MRTWRCTTLSWEYGPWYAQRPASKNFCAFLPAASPVVCHCLSLNGLVLPQDLFDEARGRERSPLLCELVAAVADSAGLREYEAERGTRREHYRAAEEEGNRRFAARQAAKQKPKL